jgi:hypothetical protein
MMSRMMMAHAGDAKWDEQREGRFRPVGGRCERIETEDGDACSRADVFCALLRVRKRPAEE